VCGAAAIRANRFLVLLDRLKLSRNVSKLEIGEKYAIQSLEGARQKSRMKLRRAQRNSRLNPLRDKGILISFEADAPKDTCWRLRPSDPLRMSEDITSSRRTRYWHHDISICAMSLPASFGLR
jgi:hypothetical protein